MDFRLTPDDERFRGEVCAWIAANLPQGRAEARSAAEKVEATRAWQAKLHAGGWAGISWPREYGGRGASIVEQLIFNEESARAGAPDGINLAVALNLVGPTLMACGTREQKARFLPRILDGEEVWCQGFSEPNAGSDLAAVRTRGEVRGDEIVVTGQKIWTSFAQHADWCILVVRTSPGSARHKGLTFVLVDMKSPGITIRPLVEMTGEAWFNEVFFDEVRVPRAHVVGDIDQGWSVVITTLAHERAGTAPHVRLQKEQRALIELARRTAAHGRPAGADPIVRQRIAQHAIEVQITRIIGYRNVTSIQRTGRPSPEGSILKLFWSEAEQRLMETATEILGVYGMLLEGEPRATDGGAWARELLWTRAATIYAGTSEVQRNIIAQRVLGLPRN